MADVIRATTPLFLAAIGGVIAIATLFAPNLPSERFNALTTLALAAISAGGGSAVQGSTSVKNQQVNVDDHP